MNLKKKLKQTLDNPRARSFYLVNDVLALLTLLSVLSIVLETVASLQQYEIFFKSIEYVTVVAFTLEYAARLYVAKQPMRYAGSFFGIIDLLAIVPTYLGVANLTYLKSARILRILRFLRILRLAKLSRTSALSQVSPITLNVSIYVTALMSAVVIFGSLMYILESHNPAFANIPLGMLWAAKSLLGGLGGSVESQVPYSQVGQILGLATRFVGLLLVGLLINVVGTVMKYILTGSKR